MQIKWIFTITLLLSSLNTFSAGIGFNEIIEESQTTQTKLASEIQTQLIDTKIQTPEQITVSQTVSLEGLVLKVY